MILSLQGCMAVGKTTAVRYIEKEAPYIHISYELNRDVVDEVKRRRLDKNTFEDYIEIQRLWLQKEVARYEAVKMFPCTLMDFGAEEIEFYTLSYPMTIGQDWNVETALRAELRAVRRCMPDRILFLNADDETLRSRKENDDTRSRSFFEYHLKNLLPLKRKWFFGRENVDILEVDGLSPEEVGRQVKKWCDLQIANQRGQ